MFWQKKGQFDRRELGLIDYEGKLLLGPYGKQWEPDIDAIAVSLGYS
jgi:hypothetical protein